MVWDIRKPDLRSSVRSIMEAKKFAEDAVREFLLFRGFTDTLQSYWLLSSSDVQLQQTATAFSSESHYCPERCARTSGNLNRKGK